MSKYAIAITEETLDLIELLNDGVRPQIEARPTSFICDIDSAGETTNHIGFTLEVFGDDPKELLVVMK